MPKTPDGTTARFRHIVCDVDLLVCSKHPCPPQQNPCQKCRGMERQGRSGQGLAVKIPQLVWDVQKHTKKLQKNAGNVKEGGSSIRSRMTK